MAYDAAEQYEKLVVPRFRPIAQELFTQSHLKPSECILEVGAGTGLLTRLMWPGQANLVVTDLSLAMMNRAREVLRLAGSSLPLGVVADVNRLPFRPSSFDVVVGNLTPLADSARAVSEAARVLRPAGRIALSTWGRSYSEMRLNNRARKLAGKGPAPYGGARKAVERLRAAGFQVERSDKHYDVEHESVSSYLRFRRSFGSPPGWTRAEAEAYFDALTTLLVTLFRGGPVRMDWNVTYLCARRA